MERYYKENNYLYASPNLVHSGKKGSKWGYTKGRRNGKKTAAMKEWDQMEKDNASRGLGTSNETTISSSGYSTKEVKYGRTLFAKRHNYKEEYKDNRRVSKSMGKYKVGYNKDGTIKYIRLRGKAAKKVESDALKKINKDLSKLSPKKAKSSSKKKKKKSSSKNSGTYFEKPRGITEITMR